jgi:hypothetical protein
VPEFQGKMRLSANPFDLVGADIEVSEGNLALIVSDHEIGEWPLEEVAIDAGVDGFHMTVDGEEFVFTTSEADAFAEAVGVSKFGSRTKSGHAKGVRTKSARSRSSHGNGASTKTVGIKKAARSDRVVPSAKTSTSEVPVAAPPLPSTKSRSKKRASGTRSVKAPRQSRGVLRRASAYIVRGLSSRQGMIGTAAAIAIVVLAILARPLLAGLLLFVGMGGVLLSGAAAVDPLLATRLPDGWSSTRLAVVALTAIVAGLVLVAF